MIPEDVRERARQVLEVAKQHLIRDGVLAPVGMVIEADGTTTVMGLAFREHREKRRAFDALCALAGRRAARAVITVMDVRYATHQHPGTVPRRFRPGEIADHPEQPEAVLVAARAADGTSMALMLPYSWQGEAIRFGDLREVEDYEDNLLRPWQGMTNKRRKVSENK